MDKFGRQMQQTGKNLSMKLTAPIVALGAISFSVFKSFEAEMSKVKAVSGATAEEFKMLSDNAKSLGASTMFTAREVAGLQTEFAKLGFTASEITKVTQATLNLAQASGSDLARAAEVAGSTLRAFGLDASQTGMLTDVMAKSFTSSAMDMETFAESMKFVAPVAKAAGMSVQETSAMLAVLANAGIKGSQAGTALRRIISEIGATGKTTGEALKDLASKGLDLADAKDEVGRSAQSALLVLAGGVDQIAPLTEAFKNSAGAAAELADEMGNNALGASKRMESAIEGLGISIGEIVAVALVPLIEWIAKLAGWLNDLGPKMKRTIVFIAGLAAAIGPLIFVTGSLIRNFIVLRAAILGFGLASKLAAIRTTAFTIAQRVATVATRLFNLALKANPIGLVIGLVAALASAMYLLTRRKKENLAVEKGLTDSAKEEIAQSKVRLSQASNLMNTIKSQNITNEQRGRLVNRLNTEYKDLLPNLISEKTSVQDITKAQREMNKQMVKKIAMIAAQDRMTEAMKLAVNMQKLYDDTLERSTKLAVESQKVFGRVLTTEEAMTAANRSGNEAKKNLGLTIASNNGLLIMYEEGLKQATEKLVDISEKVDVMSTTMTSTSVSTDEATESVSEYADALDRVRGFSTKPFEEDFGDGDEEAEDFEPGSFEALRANYVKTRLAAMELSEGISTAMKAAATDTIVGMAQIGGAILAGEATFKDMGSFILRQFATLLSQLGEMFIKYGMALVSFQIATISMNGPLAIAAGVALIGAGAAINARMSKMAEGGIPGLAEGGIVTGPTLALIGEGRESEAVIPLSKLSAMMDGGGGSQRVEVVGRISGSDILLSNERAARNRTRQRGF